MIRVTGKLITEPEVRLQLIGMGSGRYAMTVRLRQESGLPYIASNLVGETPAEYMAAKRKARVMAPGQSVTVTGTHLDLTGTRDGAIALVIHGVSEITPQIPAHHSEASQT